MRKSKTLKDRIHKGLLILAGSIVGAGLVGGTAWMFYDCMSHSDKRLENVRKVHEYMNAVDGDMERISREDVSDFINKAGPPYLGNRDAFSFFDYFTDEQIHLAIVAYENERRMREKP